MKFIKFEYQDLKGKVTQREAFVIQEPTDKVSTIDVTGLDPQDQVLFAHQYETLREAFIQEIEALKAGFDLKHNFRTFFPDKMKVQQEEVL